MCCLVFSGVSFSQATVQNEPGCLPVYDYHTDIVADQTYSYAKDIICSQTVHSSGEALSLGASIPIMSQLVPVNLSGSEWSSFQNSFCSSKENVSWASHQRYLYDQVISDNARAVMEACREPVRTVFVVSPGGTMFSFYLSVSGRDSLISAEVKPRGAVKDCDPLNPFGLAKASWLSKGQWAPMELVGKASFTFTWAPKLTSQLTLQPKTATANAFSASHLRGLFLPRRDPENVVR